MVDDLNRRSERFRTLWAAYDVKGHASGLLLLDHPLVGPLDLYFQHLTLRGTENTMVVYWAQPGTPSADALRRLVDLTEPFGHSENTSKVTASATRLSVDNAEMIERRNISRSDG